MSCSIRVSIILFYRRIFVTPLARGPRLKYAIRLMLAAQAIYLVVYSILPAFICRPLYKAWDPIERPHYFNDFYYYYTQVALYSTSMSFDAILLFFPIYPVSKLQMPLRRRAAISVVFMFGTAASIVAAYKLAIFVIEMNRYYSINPQCKSPPCRLMISGYLPFELTLPTQGFNMSSLERSLPSLTPMAGPFGFPHRRNPQLL